MKAIVFEKTGDPSVMQYVDVPKPELRPGTALLKVHAAGINFADTFFIRGEYMIKPKLPDTPGMEAAGVVEAVAPDVTGLRPGMRVTSITLKTYAEYCLIKPSQAIPLPDFVSFEEGAAFPIQVLTAWHMLHTAHKTAPGQTVVVHSAAGGVGIVAVQIAKAAGARVIGTVSSDSKSGLAREYGADDVINYAASDFAAETMRLTGGRGADLILDAVGKPTFEAGLKCLAPFGHLILYGRAGGPPDPLNPFRLFEKSVKVSGFVLPVVYTMPEVMREGIEKSFQLMREGKLKLLVGKTFPLAQAAEALRFMQSRQSVGKLVLIP
ncbi:MAG TPA: quinone oxidoreductase [Candidatus Binataceae bacterium]|nr:quinone oxidoreductase [Candidatus Binataceae bacterium]